MHDCIAERRFHFYFIATTTQWHTLVESCYHVATQSTHLFICLILSLFHATANISTSKRSVRFSGLAGSQTYQQTSTTALRQPLELNMLYTPATRRQRLLLSHEIMAGRQVFC